MNKHIGNLDEKDVGRFEGEDDKGAGPVGATNGAASSAAASNEASPALIALPGEAPPALFAAARDEEDARSVESLQSSSASFSKRFAEGFARGRGFLRGAKTVAAKPDESPADREEPILALSGTEEPEVAGASGAAPIGLPGEILLSSSDEREQELVAPTARVGWRPPALIGGGLATVGILAFVVGSFVIPKATPKPLRVAEVGAPPVDVLIAPSAKIAAVPPRAPAADPVREAPVIINKDRLLTEVLSFKDGAGASAGGAAKPEAGQNPLAAAELVPTPVVAEVGADAPSAPSGAKADAASPVAGKLSAGPMLGGAEAEKTETEPRKSSESVEGRALEARTDRAETRAPRTPPREKKSGDAAAEVRVTSVRPSDLAKLAPVPGQAAAPIEGPGSGEAAKSAHITPAQETEVLAMVTELGAMLRDAKAEIAALRSDQQKLTGAVDGELADFRRRLSLTEARRALDSAKAQPAASAEPTPAALTLPASPSAVAPKPGTGSPKGAAIAEAPAAPIEAPRRYRVQAASPGLAMLAEIDRSGDEGAQLQVAVGQSVPGYGRVKSIAQRGTAWVIQTEQGAIQ
ncbi:hypothetical protein RZS28_18820 (plasmid) [Methylocapsa polymorpha]|uniref:Uncharacterized protein n=1 Tax=Methylocapsa polymorpha TaxID=3080828 RepID=A0ABZ0HX20_9HYPH|nr:hypothetical protein [Methylocapsa sp. RX1]WOJ91783.1 hypothetical protein RZS28_18820 [Methylocapsa sp. RX1]